MNTSIRSKVMTAAWKMYKMQNHFNPSKSTLRESNFEAGYTIGYCLKVSWAHEKNQATEVIEMRDTETGKVKVSVVEVPFTYMKNSFYNGELHLTEATKVIKWRRMEAA